MATLEDSPALDKRIAQAVVSLLGAVTGLSGVTINLAENDDTIETPYISVQANRTGEAIQNSGVHEIEVSIMLKTTVHSGTNSTDDATLLSYDSAIEGFCIGQSMDALATSLTTAAEYTTVYNCQDPQSEATEFTEEKRNINYTFQVHAIGLAA